MRSLNLPALTIASGPRTSVRLNVHARASRSVPSPSTSRPNLFSGD